MQDEYEIEEPTWKCLECGKVCKLKSGAFDYSGTHCTHGAPGTYDDGEGVSDCCGADYEESIDG